jgi:hypothetical protein
MVQKIIRKLRAQLGHRPTKLRACPKLTIKSLICLESQQKCGSSPGPDLKRNPVIWHQVVKT